MSKNKVRLVVGAGALLALVVAAVVVRAQAAAGTVHGHVKVTVKGAMKPDASGLVLYLVGFNEPAAAAVPQLEMRDKVFKPVVVPITVGQTVSFPNNDSVFHNVFSASATRSFDLGQYKNGESKTKAFAAPGVVDVYCNIHPQMAATIMVLPNRRWALTGKDGKFNLEGVPVGTWTLYAYSRYADKPVKREVTVVAGQTLELEMAVDEVRTDTPHLNKFGQAYAKDGGY